MASWQEREAGLAGVYRVCQGKAQTVGDAKNGGADKHGTRLRVDYDAGHYKAERGGLTRLSLGRWFLLGSALRADLLAHLLSLGFKGTEKTAFGNFFDAGTAFFLVNLDLNFDQFLA